MVDPYEALTSLQAALIHGDISLQRCKKFPDFFVFSDNPNNKTRFTYVKIKNKEVLSFAELVLLDNRIDNLPVFHIGYAVPYMHRRKGYATEVVSVAIKELKNGLSQAVSNAEFYIEAVISTNNIASDRVANSIFSTSKEEIDDAFTGLKSFRYIQKF